MTMTTLVDVAVVVVARHGERLDYVSRDEMNINWVATAERPFDPPLTSNGMEQAKCLGRHLSLELERLGFPSISVIYSSPLLRCRQTSVGIQTGLMEPTETYTKTIETPTVERPPLRVELGLVESISEDWYRSWALPGSNGTWGYMDHGNRDYLPEAIHPLARQPVQSLFTEWKSDTALDHSYISPISAQTKPYCLYPKLLESREEQRKRMGIVANVLSQSQSTILLVSHGGPVMHLYEEIIGDEKYPGETTFCAYSIYKCFKGASSDCWEAVQLNVPQVSYQPTQLSPSS